MGKVDKKGVSPVIATVLLIGIVVVIGLIIFFWIRGITEETVEKFDKNAELVCEEVKFQAGYTSGTLSISNDGNVPIYQFMVKVSKKGSFETKNLNELSSNWPASGLNQGGGFSDDLDLTDFTDITLIPIILGSSQRGEETTFTCDGARYGYEIVL